MACRLQKLFGADAELADEDFLSAVQDAENQFAAPDSGPGPPCVPSPAPGLQPLTVQGPPPGQHSGKAPSLRPLVGQVPPPSHHSAHPPHMRPLAGQGQPVNLQGPPPTGAAHQDDLDNDLVAACVELEGPEVPAGASAAQWWEQPPRMCQGSPPEQAAPKRLRVGEGPGDRQDPQPAPQAASAPKLALRPSAAGACPPGCPSSLGKPSGSWGSVLTARALALRPLQAFQCQPGASSSSVGLWVPQAPHQSCPLPRLPPANPLACVEHPPRPPGSLQTPVVTNHLVQLVTAASKGPKAAPHLPAQGKTRRFPGPAGILPQQHSGKLEEILISAPQTPAHGAVAKPRTEVTPAQGLPSSSLPAEEDFGKGPWLAMKTELGLDERDPSCFLRTYSVVMVLRKAALKQLPKNKVPSMAVMIKTLTRTNVDAGAVFRDPTGEMQGTVHRLLLEERQSELKPGSVLLLKQVGVFSPSHRNHYLNVTPNNLLRIYPPEPEGSLSQPSPVQQEIPAQPELLLDHPVQPPQGVPAPKDWGRRRMGGHSMEHPPGEHLQSPGPRRKELVGADGCDVDDLDGLLGELPEDFFSAPAQADCC